MTEQVGTRTEHGATFFTIISYQNFQDALASTLGMCRVGVTFYDDSAGYSDPDSPP